MKIKKMNKKLGLNKATVANLEKAAMDNVLGGLYTAILCQSGPCIKTVEETEYQNCPTASYPDSWWC